MGEFSSPPVTSHQGFQESGSPLRLTVTGWGDCRWSPATVRDREIWWEGNELGPSLKQKPKKTPICLRRNTNTTVNLARFHFFLTTSFSVLESRHTPHQLVAGRTRRLPAPAHGDGHDAEGHQHQTGDQPDEVKVPWCRTWAVGVPSGLACHQRCFCMSCGPNWLTTIEWPDIWANFTIQLSNFEVSFDLYPSSSCQRWHQKWSAWNLFQIAQMFR